MESTLRDNLLRLKDAYVGASMASESTVAQAACGDWRFFERIQGKASFTVRTYDKAVRWFSARWPDDLPWPKNVERLSEKETAPVEVDPDVASALASAPTAAAEPTAARRPS